MSQRVIVGLKSEADWAVIKRCLVDEGADWFRDPSPEQPDVLVASIPDDRDVEEVMRVTKTLAGVLYVERDVLRFTL